MKLALKRTLAAVVITLGCIGVYRTAWPTKVEAQADNTQSLLLGILTTLTQIDATLQKQMQCQQCSP